jgi:hypothetical protein
MRTLKVLVLERGGYLKALVPDRAEGGARQEAIYGRDMRELLGRLKERRISEPIQFPKRTGKTWKT